MVMVVEVYLGSSDDVDSSPEAATRQAKDQARKMDMTPSRVGGGIEECMKIKMAGIKLEDMASDKYILESPRLSGKSRKKREDSKGGDIATGAVSENSLEATGQFITEHDAVYGKAAATVVNSEELRLELGSIKESADLDKPDLRKTRERRQSGEKKRKGDRKKDERKQRILEEFVGRELEDITDPKLLVKETALLLSDYYACYSSELEWQWSLVNIYLGFGVSPVTAICRLNSLSGDTNAALVYVLVNMLLLNSTYSLPQLSYCQANTVLETLEKIAPERVSEVLLKSTVLRDYKKDKVLPVLKKELSRYPHPRPCDVLALAVVVMERGTSEQVGTVLSLLRSHLLLDILLENFHLLIEANGGGDTIAATPTTPSSLTSLPSLEITLSPLALILLEHKWDIFCDVFLRLIGQSNLTLDSFCLAMMDSRPIVTCGPECNVNSLRLRDFMEAYFMEYAHSIVQSCSSDLSEQDDMSYERSISVLVSLYLASLLGAFAAKVSTGCNMQLFEHIKC